jgi:epoxyqueuosine reductase
VRSLALTEQHDGSGSTATQESLELRSRLETAGFQLISLASKESVENSIRGDLPHLRSWQEQGYAGSMAFMLRDESLFSLLENYLPAVRSVALVAVPYYADAVEKRFAQLPRTYGRVARYAAGRDYHRVLKKRLGKALAGFQGNFRIFSDAVPLLERAMARSSGDSFIGRNSLLIRRGLGSYFFLAEVLLDVELGTLQHVQRSESPGALCGRCVRCARLCPTKAIVADGVIDARRCISYLTIEREGMLDPWEQEAIGEWVLGCDVCQEVCPFNSRESRALFDELLPAAGAGVFMELPGLLDIRSDAEFAELYAGTPLMRPGRTQLLRNAACVLANRGATEALPRLKELGEEDSDPVIRSAAQASFLRLNQEKSS